MTTNVNHKFHRVREEAERVLAGNDRGEWTIPAAGIYPHQWLWDSCFIAIGLRHVNPERAATELRSLLRGQWSNGMLPHMIFTPQRRWLDDARLWQSASIEQAPRQFATSGITQPPLVAEAAKAVATSLSPAKRQQFLAEIVPAIVRYHEWLYRERDQRAGGLVALFHPWETGLDNSPAWIEELHRVHTPLWVRLADLVRIDRWFGILRRDTRRVPADERMKTSDLLRLYHAAIDLRRQGFDPAAILANPHRHFIVESLSFNSILIRNNAILTELAALARLYIPDWLQERFELARRSLSSLCDPETGVCYHRDYDSGVVEDEPTISIFLPFYSGALTQQQAKQLVRQLKRTDTYWTDYPVPTVPLTSPYFSTKRYWQGPSWLNTNWLIVDGLRRYGFESEARHIRERSLRMVAKSGMREYFSPLSGHGHGARDFSWTAALTLDLLEQTD
jgi:glycogen debranching enzyme